MDELELADITLPGTVFTDPLSALTGLLFAFALSSLIAVMYRLTHERDEGRGIIMQSLVLLSLTIAAAMMIVGNNLARAFGLVGAVSIIRFRTSLQNTRDMAFVFIAIVLGMACGLGFYSLGALFAVFVSVVIAALSFLRGARRKPRTLKFKITFRWSPERDCRAEVERQLDAAGFSLQFKASSIRSKRFTISYEARAAEGSDIDGVAARLRAALSVGDPKFALSIRDLDGNEL